MLGIRRREVIALFGAATAWPLAARGQQGDRLRRIGVLLFYAEGDPVGQANLAAFRDALRQLRWTEGRNVRLDVRWGGGDTERIAKYAAELVTLAPDILLGGGSTVRPLQRATATIPIVFAGVNDPVGGGIVASLARPGGNTTGFGGTEYSANAKLVELLKQIAPGVKRAAVLRDPTSFGSQGVFGAIQGAAIGLGVEVYNIDARSVESIERGVTAFAATLNGGLIVAPNAMVFVHREMIIDLAARLRLPAIYTSRLYVAEGGLLSYGPAGGAGGANTYRRAAGYVDRILKGENPADLPVQAPTKYELVINLKTAKALGIEAPTTVRARADEVIE